MIATERLYPIRRPLAVLLAGASVAMFGGLIGLGGAEFRLPLLIAVFALYPHRAIRINLLITFATWQCWPPTTRGRDERSPPKWGVAASRHIDFICSASAVNGETV